MPIHTHDDSRSYAEVSNHRAILAYLENDNLRWNQSQDVGTAVVVSYSFTSTSDLPTTVEYDPFNDAARYWAFDAIDQGYFRQAIEVFEAVTGVIFVETEGDAMINVFGADANSVGGWADYAYSSEAFTGSGNLVSADRDMAPGLYGFQILLHELGHAMGLAHPHEGERTLTSSLDNPSNTVMTYNNFGPNATLLGRFDLDALSELYGSSSQTAGWNAFVANDGMITVGASGRSETVMATGQDTRINAFGGNDTVIGREGADELNGNAGNDRMIGNSGADMLVGGDGNDNLIGDFADNAFTGVADTIFGGAGADQIAGGGGNDLINGGWARDTVEGDYGNDTIRGNYGADDIGGGYGNDLIFGEGGRDSVDGGFDNDVIYGGNGGDVIFGGSGNDLIGGGRGADVISGQAGDDSLYAGAGNDNVSGGADADVIGGGAENDTINGGSGEDTIFGGNGADVISGNADADTIYGGGWADVIYGGSGGDFIAGGDGADTLVGGSGSDALVGGAGADTFRFSDADNFYDDTIRDFQDGIDRIVFDFDGLSFDDLFISTQSGNTNISGAGNLALTLIGVSSAELTEADFLFI